MKTTNTARLIIRHIEWSTGASSIRTNCASNDGGLEEITATILNLPLPGLVGPGCCGLFGQRSAGHRVLTCHGRLLLAAPTRSWLRRSPGRPLPWLHPRALPAPPALARELAAIADT